MPRWSARLGGPLRDDLLVLDLVGGHDLTRTVEDDGPGAGRALVDRDDKAALLGRHDLTVATVHPSARREL